MALRDKLRERSQPFLEPGEQIQSGMWAILELGGEKLRVHKRFHKDIEEASGIGGLATA